MKKLLLLLFCAFAFPASAQQSVYVPATTNSIPITGTVAASTKIISGISGKRIYVTLVSLVPVDTSVVTFTTGTGTNCGSNTASVTGAMTFSGQVLSLGTGNGAVWALPSGFDLCVTIGTAVAPGSLSYSIF